jgi:general secretion pathway protein G
MKPRVLKHRYSLIEILIVCGILLILAGIGISVYSLVNRKMQDSRCQAMIAKMSIALENYKAKTGYYIQQPSPSSFYVDQYKNLTSPQGECSLNDFIDIPSGELAAGTGRGFWKDPWGMPFEYKCPGQHNPMSFDLHSKGENKISTGTDNDPSRADDITNWKQ